jgi:hypothetical protein
MALTTALLLCPFTVTLDIFMLKKDIAKTHYNNTGVTTLLWGKCEVATHTPENGTWESSGTPENLECNCRGQNTLHWGVFYIVGKVLKCRCPKWPCMSHLNICNISYGRKKGQESNWQFDSQPLKVGNRPDSSVCKWSATHRWKALEEGYKFALDLIPIKSWNEKLWTPKVPGVQTGTVLGFHFGSLGKKMPFRCKCGGEMQRILYGGRWWLPSNPSCVESSESKVARGVFQHQKCSKWVLTDVLVGFGCKTK